MTRPPRPTKALSVRQVRRLLAEGRQLRVVSRDNRHEFMPGGPCPDVEPVAALCLCGKPADDPDRLDDDGHPYADPDSVFDRMDARGNVRPRCR